MQAIWQRIENWLLKNASFILEDLQPGASDAEIAHAERELGINFPEDVRESFRIHNGQFSQKHFQQFMARWGTLLSLEDVVIEWKLWKESFDAGDMIEWGCHTSDPVQNEFWHPKWIPLVTSGSGDFYGLDLAPLPGGIVGQIICIAHDDNERSLLAKGFRAWLEEYAQELEDEMYTIENNRLTLNPENPIAYKRMYSHLPKQ
jgi:cell wall assembly regulator SMI1